MRRLVAGIVLPVLLLTAACGGGEDAPSEPKAGTLADVTVSGPTGTAPEVDFNAPLRFEKTQSEIVDEGPGNGPAVKPTSVVTVDYVGINARDGAEFDSSWERGKPATFQLDQVITGFSKGLVGAHAGDRVLIGVTSKDGYDPTGNGSSIVEGDSLVFVVDVRDVAGAPKPLPQSQLPELVVGKDGNPETFKARPNTPDTVPALGSYVVKQGDGPAVTSGQTITVEYLGQIFPDGTVFDESYSRKQPVSFPIGTGGVIAGWDQGLVGKKVGSRVILAIPSDLGYGAAGSGSKIPPNSDLIFVVDIVKAA